MESCLLLLDAFFTRDVGGPDGAEDERWKAVGHIGDPHFWAETLIRTLQHSHTLPYTVGSTQLYTVGRMHTTVFSVLFIYWHCGKVLMNIV